MKIEGNISKMNVALSSENDRGLRLANYSLAVGRSVIIMNDQIGNRIGFSYLGEINCIYCGRKTKTSFAQGYCYPCFTSLPQTDACVVRPELCEAHTGISRDMNWSEKNCLQEHFVYLAISSGLKVGVTKSANIPSRWIDQGAGRAIRLAKTPNRHMAGVIEVELKKHFQDKTNWRAMLMREDTKGIDLPEAKLEATNLLPAELKDFVSLDNEEVEIEYPVLSYPGKVKSINLEKSPVFEGRLTGIKGQYLIFEGGDVINIRKYSGYLMQFEIE